MGKEVLPVLLVPLGDVFEGEVFEKGTVKATVLGTYAGSAGDILLQLTNAEFVVGAIQWDSDG